MAIAIFVLLAGIISSITGGIIGDKIAGKHLLNLSRICYTSAALALPFVLGSTLVTSNFYVAITCVIMRVLIAESFWGPSVSMIQASVPQQELSSYISAW